MCAYVLSRVRIESRNNKMKTRPCNENMKTIFPVSCKNGIGSENLFITGRKINMVYWEV